jgi:hypothetical protein
LYGLIPWLEPSSESLDEFDEAEMGVSSRACSWTSVSSSCGSIVLETGNLFPFLGNFDGLPLRLFRIGAMSRSYQERFCWLETANFCSQSPDLRGAKIYGLGWIGFEKLDSEYFLNGCHVNFIDTERGRNLAKMEINNRVGGS